MKKKLVLFLCLITCLFTISACSSKKESVSFDYVEADVTQMANDFLDSWNNFDFANLTEDVVNQAVDAGQMDKETATVYLNWKKIKKDIGEFDKIISTEIKESKDKVTVVFTTAYKGTKNKVEFKVGFDSKLQPSEKSVSIEEIETLSSKLKSAGLNTILGMGTVFIVLIFISLMIGLFAYIPKIQQKMSKKKEAKAEAEVEVVSSIDNTVSQIVEQEEELVDDGELVAVITAAIMASMGDEVPADGLVVRSIKRAKTNKWQKA